MRSGAITLRESVALLKLAATPASGAVLTQVEVLFTPDAPMGIGATFFAVGSTIFSPAAARPDGFRSHGLARRPVVAPPRGAVAAAVHRRGFGDRHLVPGDVDAGAGVRAVARRVVAR